MQFIRGTKLIRKTLSSRNMSMNAFKGEEFSIPVPWGIITGKKWGDPNGHPWIATHGWLNNCSTYDKLAPLFPEKHLLYCADFPGHGLSSHLPPGVYYHPFENSQYIKRIVLHFNLEKFGLIGHSLGGGVSTMYAGIYPETVTHLISLDVIRFVSRTKTQIIDRARTSLDSFFHMEEKSKSLERVYKYEDLFERFYTYVASINKDDTACKESVKILLKRGMKKSDCGTGYVPTRDHRLLVASLQSYPHEILFEYVKRVNLPHLIIKARDSHHLGEENEIMEVVYHRMANNPNFYYKEVDGHHHVHLDHPERVIPLIEEFLTKYPVEK